MDGQSSTIESSVNLSHVINLEPGYYWLKRDLNQQAAKPHLAKGEDEFVFRVTEKGIYFHSRIYNLAEFKALRLNQNAKIMAIDPPRGF